MFASASQCYDKANKWKHQVIHKKCNKMQYASKHYGTSLLIQKRKNPVKQRRDRKKFKIQRNRKKIYKRMSFDYHDFLYKNKTENYKRIQTRPTTSYYHCNQNECDINSMFNTYYKQRENEKAIYNDNDIPIWQCYVCTYINIEKLPFCSMCNNPYKYDYDNHGYSNHGFYPIKYSKNNKKKYKNTKKRNTMNRKQENDNYNEFKKYWNEMATLQNEYKEYEIQINDKLKQCKNKTMNGGNYKLIMVLSIKNKKNGFPINYKSNQCMYSRIVHQNDLLFEPVIITEIPHYYPFYLIPCCLEPKMYDDLLKNNNSFENDLSFVVWRVKQQLQPQLFKLNNILEQMINNYKKSLYTIEECAINSADFLTSLQNVEDKSFNIQLDVLMNKRMDMTSRNKNSFVIQHNKQWTHVQGIHAVKTETFLLKEICLKIYNENNDQINSYQLLFNNEYDRNIPIFTSPFKMTSSQIDINNDSMLNVARKCIDVIFGDDTANNGKFMFDESHVPHYNLLPLSFKISRILYQYIPSTDIINSICIPFIGYDKMYYVTINAKIDNPQNIEIEINTDSDKQTEITEPTDNSENEVYSPIYIQLIEMGFEDAMSLEATRNHPNNINDAIDWIRNSERVNNKNNSKKTIADSKLSYSYDINWEAIALNLEEEESSSHLFGICDSSSDYSSSSD